MRWLALSLVLSSLLLPALVRAGGTELGGLGARSLGRGHAVIASVDDATAIEVNPAALSRQRGLRTLLVLNPTYHVVKYRRAPLYDTAKETPRTPPPPRQYEEVENEAPLFPLSGGFLGLSGDLAAFGLDDVVLGLAIYGPNGIGKTVYPEDSPGRYMLISKDITLMNLAFSGAWGRDDFGLGATFHAYIMPKNRLKMVVDADNQSVAAHPHESPSDVLVEMNSTDYFTPTLSLGAWYRPMSRLEIGLSGRVIPVRIEGEGDIKLTGQGAMLEGLEMRTGELEGNTLTPNDAATLRFNLAPSARLGLRYLVGAPQAPDFDVELDVIWEGWSVFEQYDIALPSAGEVTELGLQVPLEDMVIPRHWQDVWIVRLGGEVAAIKDRLDLRLGGFYETPTVPNEYTYLDFMGFERLGVGAGLTLHFGRVHVDLGYLHIFNEPRAVSEAEGLMYQQRPTSPCKAPYTSPQCDPNYLGQPGPVANAGTFLSSYDQLSAGVEVVW
ncbi:outer membrane protein transport protein [Myxococcota bacterium]|nr:outer membrane protein transport protein [Myxococcota bacterium]MBU1898016.1 outer membrane protein transport protein [Myxococcota bacterium]